MLFLKDVNIDQGPLNPSHYVLPTKGDVGGGSVSLAVSFATISFLLLVLQGLPSQTHKTPHLLCNIRPYDRQADNTFHCSEQDGVVCFF